jgi:hypothetical protein
MAGAAWAFGFGASAHAQLASVVVTPVPCLPMEGNAAIYAAVSPPVPETTLRAYFQRQDFGDQYYVTMNALGGGNFWGVLPKPERQNEVVEYHLTAFDAAGAVINSTETFRAVVLSDCESKLSEREERQSESLAIGETTIDQKGRPVAWFLCDGITHRIDTRGKRRPDEFCAVPPPPIPIIDQGTIPHRVPASPFRPGCDPLAPNSPNCSSGSGPTRP